MTAKVPVTIAKGDGIGPEIMDATLKIMEAAGAQIEPEFVLLGEKVFLDGNDTGIEPEAITSINRTGVFLKAPITTPQGGGYKSVNVTLRKTFGLFANVRPTRTFVPFVKSKHDNVDLVIVRENEEDLYAGMEYRQTHDSCHSLKVLSRSGCEMIVRYAFEYARAHGRKKVSCLIKDNIMKISDGLFHTVFKLISKEYPEIEAESYIVDIGMARVADTPEDFDVIVTLNLYGDIVSDIASQISGSVGLAGSSNMGSDVAMFEAIHGSAPDITGQGIANPSGLLNGAILMLHHIGQSDAAAKIENAWLYTLENGQHTSDVATDKSKALSTAEFADAVIGNLGQEPANLPKVKAEDFKQMHMPKRCETTVSARTKRLMGADVFLEWTGENANQLGDIVAKLGNDNLKLKLISNRGLVMYPNADRIDVCGDYWCCRFTGLEDKVSGQDIKDVLKAMTEADLDWVKVENLYTFDNERGYSLFQGESEK